MKFLCVSCDEAMKLRVVQPPERGSLTVVYRCPSCGHEFAMLTNPYETQVVGSLGVEIGARADGEPGTASGCPFSSVVQGLGAAPEGSLPWTPEATSRLESIPEFARPMARSGIETFARERGLDEIDTRVLEQAREFFGM